MCILNNVSEIKSSTANNNLRSYDQEQLTQEQVHHSENEDQYSQDDLTQSIVELLSDKKKRKAKQIISELKLKCNKQYLNQKYLYPMKDKGILNSEEWFWKLSQA
tara:strand:- start:100 stop:414 length:315 start_codon:yes stop_codon:yes gene_type:complete